VLSIQPISQHTQQPTVGTYKTEYWFSTSNQATIDWLLHTLPIQTRLYQDWSKSIPCLDLEYIYSWCLSTTWLLFVWVWTLWLILRDRGKLSVFEKNMLQGGYLWIICPKLYFPHKQVLPAVCPLRHSLDRWLSLNTCHNLFLLYKCRLRGVWEKNV